MCCNQAQEGACEWFLNVVKYPVKYPVLDFGNQFWNPFSILTSFVHPLGSERVSKCEISGSRLKFLKSSLESSFNFEMICAPSRFREGARMLSLRPKLLFQKSKLNSFVVAI